MRPALLTLLLGSLAIAMSAGAEGEWVLWAARATSGARRAPARGNDGRPTRPSGGAGPARTTLVNQAFTREGWQTTATKGKVMEYQCLPSSASPGDPAPK